MSQSLSSETKYILHLAWPLIGTHLLHISMVFVDNAFVGRLGAEPLAALAIALTFFHFFYVFCAGLFTALTPMIAGAHGAGDDALVGRIVRQGLRLVIPFSIVVIIFIYQSSNVLRWMGQSPELIPLAQVYLRSLVWGIPPMLAVICLRLFNEALSNTRTSIVVTAIGAGANVVLDYMLIFGKWGAPALGIAGAAYTTALVQWIMFLVLGGYLLWHPDYHKYGLAKGPYKTDWQTIKSIVALGLPISATMLGEMSFFMTTTLIMGLLGTKALASHQIALNSAAFVFMIPIGLSMAASIRVGQYWGRYDYDGIARAGKASYCIGLVTQSLTSALFLFFPHLIVKVYTNDPQLTDLAVTLLRIAGIFQLFDGFQSIGVGLLRGLKDTRIPFIAVIVSFWGLGMISGYLMTFVFDMGPKGLWYGMLFGLMAATFFHASRFYQKIKNN